MSGRGGGRGAYYKARYGGGRGRGGGRDHAPQTADGYGGGGQREQQPTPQGVRGGSAELRAALLQMEGRPYPAYHDVEGLWAYEGGQFTLSLDRAQSDPFAAPSRFRVMVPAGVAGFPQELWQSKIRSIALADFLTRAFGAAVSSAGADLKAQGGGWHGEKGGDMEVDFPGQHVLERTSVILTQGAVEARFTVGLPAMGRSILGQRAAQILVDNLPRYVQKGLLYASLPAADVKRHVECVETTEALRGMLPSLGLVGFVADGSSLPRQSGANDAPLAKASGAVPFVSPESLALEVDLPNRGRVRGMGIRQGVTLIVGGGFHGKSTLLKALEVGVYNKVPGDGRELVVADASAVKIRAEDGRRVAGVNITAFISNLPFGKDTASFSTDDASGSTSQAAAILEALEVGATTLLLDEDLCATNAMIRDERMQALVSKDKEPITPFISRVRALVAAGVSTVLVIGGSGDYFGVADTVICMDSYQARDVTAEAHAIDARFGRCPSASQGAGAAFTVPTPRIPTLVYPHQGGRLKVSTRQANLVTFGDLDLDLSAVEQLVEKSQTRAIAEALQELMGRVGRQDLRTLLHTLEQDSDRLGLDALTGGHKAGNLARPRLAEVAAALNRLRTLQVRQGAVN